MRLASGGQSARRGAAYGAGLISVIAVLIAWTVPAASALAADPAVEFMQKVSRELILAQRSRSEALMAAAINRYGANSAIALSALGDYRPKLAATDHPSLVTGTVAFLARYATAESSKYPVSNVEFLPESRRAKYGLMVDSKIILRDGSSYDVSWMVVKVGTTYRVRDAQVMGFWMTPFLQKLYEDYIGQNGGNPKALLTALNR